MDTKPVRSHGPSTFFGLVPVSSSLTGPTRDLYGTSVCGMGKAIITDGGLENYSIDFYRTAGTVVPSDWQLGYARVLYLACESIVNSKYSVPVNLRA